MGFFPGLGAIGIVAKNRFDGATAIRKPSLSRFAVKYWGPIQPRGAVPVEVSATLTIFWF